MGTTGGREKSLGWSQSYPVWGAGRRLEEAKGPVHIHTMSTLLHTCFDVPPQAPLKKTERDVLEAGGPGLTDLAAPGTAGVGGSRE